MAEIYQITVVGKYRAGWISQILAPLPEELYVLGSQGWRTPLLLVLGEKCKGGGANLVCP